MTANAQKKERYFLIGWVGWDSASGHSIGGGYDTTLYRYPNVYRFKEFFKRKFHVNEVYIYGVTEFKPDDRKDFWEKTKDY